MNTNSCRIAVNDQYRRASWDNPQHKSERFKVRGPDGIKEADIDNPWHYHFVGGGWGSKRDWERVYRR